MSKRAVILAGGKGTRLKPYTISLPKPLVPIVDTPTIEIIIKQLVKNGFDHITLTVNHMAEIIKAFCGDGSKWGIKIDYSHEKKALSTIAPIKLISELPRNFLLMNGDVITDLDFSSFYNSHSHKNNLFTIASASRKHVNNYGVLSHRDGVLTNFQEKPSIAFEVSMGIYMVNKDILNLIPEDTFFGFDDLMYKMLESNIRVDVVNHKGYWLDIGRPDDYTKATIDYDAVISRLI